MFIKQLFTGNNNKAAYYIESNGEAAIIDPTRDTAIYVELAKERNVVIKFIFETHFHADFVSGHLDLSEKTGAPIIYGPETITPFKIKKATDGEIFDLGKLFIKVLHTPGHTLESSCFILRDEAGNESAIFTGDTLLAGDVGRPDLSTANLTSEELAAIMYDTIQTKILPLANDLLVYPAHGTSIQNGKNLDSITVSNIGDEKKNNFALQPQTKGEFIKAVTRDLQDAPNYFQTIALLNKNGYESLEKIKATALTAIDITYFKEKIKTDVTILDSRNAALFLNGFIPGSIFIGLEGKFAEWCGSLLPYNKPIVLVTENGKEEETVVRLASVGFSNITGYLKGGFDAWINANEKTDLIIDVEADEFAMDLPHDNNLIAVDVRKTAEFAAGHVKDALNIPLSDLTDVALMASFEDNQNLYIYCGGGYRSIIAASLFKKQGIHNLRNIAGGWAIIKTIKKIKTEKQSSELN